MTSNTNRYTPWYKTELGETIIRKKYMHSDETTTEQFFERVASIFSNPEDIRLALKNADFFPAGRSLYAAGAKGKFKATMSNCYILPSPEDNLESIFGVNAKSARIYSYGGGCGISLDKLRPKGAKVHNAAKTSTGPVSYLDIYNSTGSVIGANNRRAALLMGLSCTHPDIGDFINAKQNNVALQACNLSVLWNNDFMSKVNNDMEWGCQFEVESTGEIITHYPNPKKLFDQFCQVNYDFAEPGAIFIDNVRKHTLVSGFDEYKIDISNPCAEYFGNAFNSCNLGSINLYNCVENPFQMNPSIDWGKLKYLVRLGVRALDETLDYGYDTQPLTENKQCITDWRAIGLGVFGYADMLVALGLKYGSDKAIEFTRILFQFIQGASIEASAEIAGEKEPFGKYNLSLIEKSEIFQNLGKPQKEMIRVNGLRNAQILSIAPTGTIATMCGLSGGIEPLFRVDYERTTHSLEKSGKTFHVFAKSVEDLMTERNWGLYHNKEDLQKFFPYVVDSEDISPQARINTQAAIQVYVDNAISSTVNLRNDATVNDIRNLYVDAWKQGCKGITVFRDGCSRTSILKSEPKQEETPKSKIVFNSVTPESRGSRKVVPGNIVTGHTACSKNFYTIVGKVDGEIFEVFTGSEGGCQANRNAITKMTSLALRCGVSRDKIISELKSCLCPACNVLQRQGEKDINNSCAACIAEAIELSVDAPIKVVESELAECPECHSKTLRPEGKCNSCYNCGYSKCE